MTYIVRMLLSLVIILLSITVPGCATNPNDYTSGALFFRLSNSTLMDTIRKARNGDGVAAYALYKHYALGFADLQNGNYWLRVSAALGNEFAISLLRQLEEAAQDTTPNPSNEVIDNPFGPDP